MIIRKTRGLIQCTRATKPMLGTSVAREDIIERTNNLPDCSEGLFLQTRDRTHCYQETFIIQTIKSGRALGHILNFPGSKVSPHGKESLCPGADFIDRNIWFN